ncbi:MAG: hypothetical protein ABFD03_10830 [Clostridiaceae bacterium]|nr:hypothetical protein [Feifaniaceae bacterium]
MMKVNVCNLERFFQVVNSCEHPVKLVVSEANAEDLRGNEFVQGLLLDMQDGITELSIETEDSLDAMSLLRFMMEDGRSPEGCKNASLVNAA